MNNEDIVSLMERYKKNCSNLKSATRHRYPRRKRRNLSPYRRSRKAKPNRFRRKCRKMQSL